MVDDAGASVQGLKVVSLSAFWGSEIKMLSSLVIEESSQSRSSVLVKVVEFVNACICFCGHCC